MPHQIRCPSCDTTVEVPDERLGRSVECGRCGSVFKATNIERSTLMPRADSDLDPYVRAEIPTPPPERSRRRDDDYDFDRYDFRRGRRYDRSTALAKVQGPGTLLQLAGVLLLLLSPLCVLGALWAGSEISQQPKKPGATGLGNEEAIFVMIGSIFGAVSGFLAGPLLILGGSRMKALRSYGLALTATIVLFSLGFLSCILLLAAGVWPLVVLLDPNVKEAFSREARAG